MNRTFFSVLPVFIIMSIPAFLTAQVNSSVLNRSNNLVFVNPDNNLSYLQSVSIENTTSGSTAPTKPVNSIVAKQLVYSPLVGLLFGFAGAAAGYAIDMSGSHDDFDGLVGIVFGGSLGLITGTSLGVYKIGQRNGLDGSLTVTFLSSFVGTVAGLAASVAGENVIPLLFIPQACATIGYHISL